MKQVNVEIISDYELRKAFEQAAGRDLLAKNEPTIVGSYAKNGLWKRIDYIEYDTGVAIAPESNIHSLLMPRSSLSKYNLVLANSVGLIDSDYRGNLIFRFKYVFQPEDMVLVNDAASENDPAKMPSLYGRVNKDRIYKIGDYIGQLVFAETLQPNFDNVLILNPTLRGSNGFGKSDLLK